MKINWQNLFQNEEQQFLGMTEPERYQYFLLLQAGSPYGWGKENPESSDCSGAVCMALAAATGFFIRTTADELFRKIYTVKNPPAGTIQAAFWITPDSRQHGGRAVPAGTATHVAGIVGRGNAVLSPEEPKALVSTVPAVPAAGRIVEIRGLDRAALEQAAKDNYSFDPEFWKYFQK
ncbi:MAG: peptidoglycan endopeptidase [Spirochaetales bacterium]|jgi:murein DD-endopeptidase|nr:peptidoglycan endopeptidase [Spirochaetales bacterium]